MRSPRPHSLILGIVLVALAAFSSAFAVDDPARFVNPFVGTDGHGHTFPGATQPFGMVQASPDTRVLGWDACSGYHYSDRFIYGISHTHLSGVGIPDYCDILLAPQSGEPTMTTPQPDKGIRGYGSHFSHAREQAEPGYYEVFLEDQKVDVELTTTPRVALHRYTFTDDAPKSLVIDLEHRDLVLDAELRIVSPTEVAGFRRSAAWAKDQLIYFVLRFEKPVESVRLFSESAPASTSSLTGKKLKALVIFRSSTDRVVQCKVALSPTGIEGARRNLDTELTGWDFAATRAAARAEWNRVLSKIDIEASPAGLAKQAKKTKESGSVQPSSPSPPSRDTASANLRTFYTALYHAYLCPNIFSDADGTYRGRDGKLRHADHGYYTVFSLWDTYRAWHPLMTILEPTATRDFIRTFLLMYQQGGLLPVWDLAGNETFCMNGYHSVSVIADAYVKGIRGFDTELALAAMKHSATQDQFGLAAYRRDGFIAREQGREGVARTLEYAYDDWCIARFADMLGRSADRDEYLRRSQSYRHLFSPQEHFFIARENGGWYAPFNPREINFNYTEGNAWQYRFAVPHDLPRLIEMFGGDAAFGAALDGLFAELARTEGREQADVTGLIGQYAQGNEPDHHVPYLYNFIGRPSETQRRVREIMSTLYSDRPDGLCGNEDCGQMSAWFIMSALGLYQVTPGTTQYVIGSPLFERASVDIGRGKRFSVTARNQSAANVYIASAKLNGEPLTRSYLTHAEIMAGGELELTMRSAPDSDWATALKDRPGVRVPEMGVVPAPAVSVPLSFRSEATVTMQGASSDDTLWYTLDGSDPRPGASTKCTGPFTIKESVKLALMAVRKGGVGRGLLTPLIESRTDTLARSRQESKIRRAAAGSGDPALQSSHSPIVRAEAHRADTGLHVNVRTPINPQYLAGGPEALVDGVLGGPDFTTGRWQGYEDAALDAVVDLGRVSHIRGVTVGFLQDANVYIFYPNEVRFEISDDGVHFRELETVRPPATPRDTTTSTIERVATQASGEGRYVRVYAPNPGRTLAWGSATEMIKSFLFCDEIQIERE